MTKENRKLRFYKQSTLEMFTPFQLSLKGFFAINFHNFLMSHEGKIPRSPCREWGGRGTLFFKQKFMKEQTIQKKKRKNPQNTQLSWVGPTRLPLFSIKHTVLLLCLDLPSI